MHIYDLIIIGAGPAGITASVYAARKKLDFLVISLDVGGQPEFRIRKGKEAGGGVAFADYVWKPVVLIEMKKRGEDLTRHYRQAFDYWTRLVPGRPRYAVLCNFDEFWVYDFETQLDTPVDTVPLDDLPEHPQHNPWL